MGLSAFFLQNGLCFIPGFLSVYCHSAQTHSIFKVEYLSDAAGI